MAQDCSQQTVPTHPDALIPRMRRLSAARWECPVCTKENLIELNVGSPNPNSGQTGLLRAHLLGIVHLESISWVDTPSTFTVQAASIDSQHSHGGHSSA